MTVNEFNTFLDEIGLSKKEFASKTKTNYSGICAWNDEKRPIPSWVESWLENYKKSKTLDIVIEAIDAVRK